MAEVRSKAENSNRPPQEVRVKYKAPMKGSAVSGMVLYVSIPYIDQEIPLGIVFRALDYVSDRHILQLILYGAEDRQMMDCLRPSLEESIIIQRQVRNRRPLGSARP
jgi:DNA-directed RNA polymerase II subunit RPB2